MDYNVNVNVKGKEKVDTLEKQLNTLAKKPVKIAVDIDSKNADAALNKLSKSVEKHKIKPSVDTSGLLSAVDSFGKSADEALSIAGRIAQAASSAIQNIESAGTAYETISLRLRGASDELKAAGLDTEGMAASVTKLREELLSLSGVDIMLHTGSLKSTLDILDELSLKWKSLSDSQQASVTELIAGKSQSDIVPALMKNFNQARSLLNTASNGSGGNGENALSSNQKAMQSSTEALKAQLQELLASDPGSAFLQGAVGAGTNFLDFLKQIANARKMIAPVLSDIKDPESNLSKNLDLFYN